MPEITITPEDDWFVITDEETGVTTQGRTKLEALLMLADALAAHDGTDEDLLATAVDVFVVDPEAVASLAEIEGLDVEPPGVDETRVRRQREAVLRLARTHAFVDYSNPRWFHTLATLLLGRDVGPSAVPFEDPRTDQGEDATVGDDCDVAVPESVEDRFADVAEEVTRLEDSNEAVDELRARLAEYAKAGAPMLQPPLPPEAIERIDDDRLRAIAWDLDAIARAYNYASDPSLPDLAQEEPRPWISPEERHLLERACALLLTVYVALYDRVADDFEAYTAGD